MIKLLFTALCWFGFALCANAQDASTEVDVELVLAVDVSGSMSFEELRIQRLGYVEAFRSSEVAAAIEKGLLGKVAITYVEWARSDLKKVLVPWTLIENAGDANAFAERLVTAEYENMRRTSISGAINYAVNQLQKNRFNALRQVIDISGDGPNNEGGLVTLQRDRAIAQGVVINGLPIMAHGNADFIGRGGNWPELDIYYRACVIGGPGAFVIPVNTWDEFPEAVRRKLVLELAGLPIQPLVQKVFGHELPQADCLMGEKARQWQNP